MIILPDHIRETNHRRVDRWHDKDTDDWTLGDWGAALAGELGEMLNVVKKMRRIQSGASRAYNTPEMEVLREKFAEELADTLLYLDLYVLKVSEVCGIPTNHDSDLLLAVIDKFNKVSEAQGWPDLTVDMWAPGDPLSVASVGLDPTEPEVVETHHCMCGEYQLTGTRVDERNGILHRVDDPCQVIVIG